MVICKSSLSSPNSPFNQIASLRTSLNNSYVLSLFSRQCSCILPGSLPTNSTITNSKDIPCKRSPLIKVSSKIRIDIPNDSFSSSPKLQTSIRKAMQVSENSLNCLPIFFTGIYHVSTNCTDYI